MAMDKDTQAAYNSWLKRLGKTVAALRKQAKFTQSQMAERTGFDMKYYQDIEYGRRPITTRTLYQLCSGIGIEVHDLVNKANR